MLFGKGADIFQSELLNAQSTQMHPCTCSQYVHVPMCVCLLVCVEPPLSED